LSQNPSLGLEKIPPEISYLRNLTDLRLEQCGITELPCQILETLTELKSLDLAKNNIKVFFDDPHTKDLIVDRSQINLPSLSYLNLNGNQLTKIPKIVRYLPNLKQLHLHMNRIEDVEELCRESMKGLEVLDLGGNKIQVVPIALIKYLGNLTALTLMNNDI